MPSRRRARRGGVIGPRRGAIGNAAVIVLVFVQLLLVGAITSGAREADTSEQRLNTLRAFYAAEGGMNMAIREVLTNSDDDGDGAIGTISDNGSPSDDPTIGAARTYVVKAISAGTTTVVSRGRAGIARRQLATDIE